MLKFHATPIHFAAASAAFFMPAPAALAQSVASIDGLEVTQSTQHYESNRHLSNASDYGPTNSLALIERKAVFVRAYVRGGTSAGVQLTGTLTIERQGAQGWEPVASVEARAPVTMVAQPDYRTVRGDMGRTLAFAIPATEVHGILRLTARARRVGQTTVAAERQVVLPRPLLRTLRVAAITVGYNGPRPGSRDRIEAPPPTLQDVERTAGTTLAAFPVGAEAEFRIAGTITQTEPLLTGQIAPMFACPRTWSDLMRRVRRIRAADGPRPGWVYYGLLAAELPFKSSTVGCGGGGVGTGKTDWDWTMAHEIGHAAGLPHIPGRNNRCTGDGADSRYPRYRPYRRGSIGEYGVDIRTGAVHRPAGANDLMQYCGPRWISPYHHRLLVNAPILQVETGAVAPAYGPVLHLGGILNGAGDVGEVDMLRYSGRKEPAGAAVPGLTAVLLDSKGSVLASGPVYATSLSEDSNPASGRDPKCPCILEAVMDDHSGAARARISYHGKTVWESQAAMPAASQPVLTAIPSPEGVRLTWTGLMSGSEVWVRYSDDQGRTWSMLDVGTFGGSYAVDRARLRGGGALIFEILSPSGFTTTRAVSQPIEVGRAR